MNDLRFSVGHRNFVIHEESFTAMRILAAILIIAIIATVLVTVVAISKDKASEAETAITTGVQSFIDDYSEIGGESVDEGFTAYEREKSEELFSLAH